jgi:hypothetical protein
MKREATKNVEKYYLILFIQHFVFKGEALVLILYKSVKVNNISSKRNNLLSSSAWSKGIRAISLARRSTFLSLKITLSGFQNT